ncbi:Crp/Fnr family transcriptional regulator, partial [Vibrio sp. S457-15]
PEMMVFFASALARDYQDSMDNYTKRLLHPLTYVIPYDHLVRNQADTLLGGFDKVNQAAERFGTSGRVYPREVKNFIGKGLIAKNVHGLAILDEKA